MRGRPAGVARASWFFGCRVGAGFNSRQCAAELDRSVGTWARQVCLMVAVVILACSGSNAMALQRFRPPTKLLGPTISHGRARVAIVVRSHGTLAARGRMRVQRPLRSSFLPELVAQRGVQAAVSRTG